MPDRGRLCIPLGLEASADLGELECVGPARHTFDLLEREIVIDDHAPSVPARALDFVCVTHFTRFSATLGRLR